MKGLWPQWTATDAEVRVWTSELAPFEYDLARAAVQACFRRQAANYHRPVLAKFLEQARALSRPARGGRRQRPDPTTNVFVECLEPPPHRPNLAGARKPVFTTKQDDPDHVRACAESMRAKCEQLYGGHWITVATKPSHDDGLQGKPAEEKAFQQILAGPDTPGKRWLQALLTARAKAMKCTLDIAAQDERPASHTRRNAPAGEPVPIGEALSPACDTQDWLAGIPISLSSPTINDPPPPASALRSSHRGR